MFRIDAFEAVCCRCCCRGDQPKDLVIGGGASQGDLDWVFAVERADGVDSGDYSQTFRSRRGPQNLSTVELPGHVVLPVQCLDPGNGAHPLHQRPHPFGLGTQFGRYGVVAAPVAGDGLGLGERCRFVYLAVDVREYSDGWNDPRDPSLGRRCQLCRDEQQQLLVFPHGEADIKAMSAVV